MANNYTAEVLRYLRRKGASGYDEPTYLGAEQRFVGAIRNSSVNNLEEQFVLGTDTYTEEYEDNQGNQIIVKHFCKVDNSPSETSNYYKLVTIKYDSPLANSDYYYDDDIFVLPNDPSQVVFGDGSASYPNTAAVYGVDRTIFNLTAGGAVEVFPPSVSTLQEDNLYFVRPGQSDLLVLTKTTGTKYITESGIDKKVVKESIVNHLTT